jgi:hypothetical protein
MLSRNPFRRPFPERPFGRSVVLGHVRTAVFVFIALLFIFDLPLALAYGAVVFVIAVVYSYLTEQLGATRSGPDWTLMRWTLDQAALLFIVSCACFLLYNATVGWAVLNLRVLLYITIPTVLVGLIPIVFSGIAQQLRAEQDHQRIASSLQLSILGADAGTKEIPESIVYGKRLTEQSVEIHRASGSEVAAKPLHSLLADHPDGEIVRSHPDYLVNPSYAIAVTADAQGLWLRLRDVEASVPVSPEYFDRLR